MIKNHRIIPYLLILSASYFTAAGLHANALTPAEQQQYRIVKTGMASWYSETDPGIRKTTANMEIFDDSQLTAAMWDVPFHQRIRVTNLANGQSVIVRVNDRGPHRRFVRQGRIIDLSKAAFAQISSLNKGLIDIQLEFL